MDRFTYGEIMSAVDLLVADQTLNRIIYFAGGIVPYLYADQASHRRHNDIDIVAHADDMAAIRARMKALGFYDARYDSLSFSFNQNGTDHGLEVLIHNIPVNVAPFSTDGHDILQRNFLKEETAGADALMTATMKEIALTDYVTRLTRTDGSGTGTYTIEMVKAAKENSSRDKDRHDIEIINRLGIDEQRYNRVKPVVAGMQILVETSEGVHR